MTQREIESAMEEIHLERELNYNTAKSLKIKRDYHRIPDNLRQRLIEMIAENQMTIKDAARKLRINYSTAKNIVKIHNQQREVNTRPRSQPRRILTDPIFDKTGPPFKRFIVSKACLNFDNTQMMTPSVFTNQISDPKIIAKNKEENQITFNFFI